MFELFLQNRLTSTVAKIPLLLYIYCTWNVNTYSEFIQCPELGIDNGEVDIAPNDRSLYARSTYKCSSGYNLQGSSERFCQVNSTWNGTDPLCGKC